MGNLEDVAIDSTGNIVVAGSRAQPNAPQEGLLTCYSAAGQQLWELHLTGPGSERSGGVAIDPSGDIYWVGSADEGAILAGSSFTKPGNHDDIFVAKLNSTGNLLWVKAIGGTGGDTGLRVVADGSGATITGTSSALSLDIGTSKWAGPGSLVAGIASNGTWMWAQSLQGAPNALASDGTGHFFTTGYFVETAKFGDLSVTSLGGADVFIARLTKGGWDWVISGGGIGTERGTGLMLDNSGHVKIVGHSFQGVQGGTLNFGAISVTTAQWDTLLASISPLGTFDWAITAGDPCEDSGRDIAYGGPGREFVLRKIGNHCACPGANEYCLKVAAVNANGASTWSITLPTDSLLFDGGRLAASGKMLATVDGTTLSAIQAP